MGGRAGPDGTVPIDRSDPARARDAALEALDAAASAVDDDVVRTAGAARLRARCEVSGTVVSTGRATGPQVALDVVVADATGRILCHFFGRDAIPGLAVGTRVRVAGRLVTYRSRRCLLNPAYELLGPADGDAADGAAPGGSADSS